MKHYLAKFSPSMVVLDETEVRPSKEYGIMKCLPKCWQVLNNYEFSNLGRIWIYWNPNIWQCQVYNKSLQQITIIASNKDSFNMLLNAVYSSNWQSRREELWKELETVHQQHGTLPWACIGDFNIVRYSDEKIGGRGLSYTQLKISMSVKINVFYLISEAQEVYGLGIIRCWVLEELQLCSET